ncbi:MAG: glycoside hydrolase family 65 protein [Flavobacterium sp.]|nr:glycoside hydrolase family 65 protein [Flavobacterium sp.]
MSFLFVYFLGNTVSFAQSTLDQLWEVKAIDTTNYTPAYLGNGIIGFKSLKSGLGAERVVINGLYDRSAIGDNVRLINYFNPMNLNLTFKDKSDLEFGSKVSNWQQSLNLKEAILTTSYSYGGILNVKSEMLALRNLPMTTMGIYEFTALADTEFTIKNVMKMPDRSNSSSIYKPYANYGLYRLGNSSKEKIAVMSAGFPTESGTDCVAGANTYFFNGHSPEIKYTKLDNNNQQCAFTIKLKKGEKFSFTILSAFTHSRFTKDVYNDAVRICSKDYNLGYSKLVASHKLEWEKLWKNDIEIDGDNEAQIDVRLGLYSLYSSITNGFELSIPPCGLAETGWGGHIFWDAELWMYPALLVMKPDFAQSMIDFRFNTLNQAKNRAAQFGYKGAMYPWESDLHGNECTPISYKLDMNEHHVTADVAIAAWNYYQVTKNKLWLKEKGFPIIKEVADFWVSRAEKDEKGLYHIKNVVGPDEYFEDVDDDAFTNGAVKVVLDAAIKSAKLINKEEDAMWTDVLNNIVILKHKDGYTLQNAQYTGQKIKQADVNLLAFPLEYITDKKQIEADLKFYEPKIDPNGPSMSYSVLATSYARLEATDKAYQLFQKSYQPNRKPPFGFISEKPRKSASVFCTGYGGMLQTVLFGFAGMNINEKGLYQNKANLPSNWKKLTIKREGKKDIICVK